MPFATPNQWWEEPMTGGEEPWNHIPGDTSEAADPLTIFGGNTNQVDARLLGTGSLPISLGGTDPNPQHSIFNPSPSGGKGGPTVLPINGIDVPTAIAISIIASGGVPDIFAPGATPGQLVDRGQEILTHPVDTTGQTINNIGNQTRGIFRPDPENDAKDPVVIPVGAIGGNPSPATTVGNPRQAVGANGQTTNSTATQGMGQTASGNIVVPGGQSGQGDNGYPAQRTATVTPTGGGTDSNGRSTVINGIDTNTGKPVDGGPTGPDRVSPSGIVPYGGTPTDNPNHNAAVTLLNNARTNPGGPSIPPVFTVPVNLPKTNTTMGSPPSNRNYYEEGKLGSDAYAGLGQGLFNNYGQFAPQYGQNDLDSLGRLYGLSGTQTIGGINNASRNALQGSLTGDLQNAAQGQLALGSSLSDQQKRDATQSAREAWSARGLINSNGAIGAEILNRDAYGQQLLQQREGFALAANPQVMQNQNDLNKMGIGFSSGNYSNQFVQQQGNPFNAYANDVYGSNFNAGYSNYLNQMDNATAEKIGQQKNTADYTSMFMKALYGIGSSKGWF